MKSTRSSKGKSSSPTKPVGSAAPSAGQQADAEREGAGQGGRERNSARTSAEAAPGRSSPSPAQPSPSAETSPSVWTRTSKQTDDPLQSSEPPTREQAARPDEGLHDRIAERAYRLYVADGYPEGRAVEHWLQAERELASERQEWDH